MCVNAVNDMVAVGKKNDDDTFSHDRILFEKENVVKYRIMQSTLQLNTHTHKNENFIQNIYKICWTVSICAHVHSSITAFAYINFWIDKMMPHHKQGACIQPCVCVYNGVCHKNHRKVFGISNFYYEIHIH